MPSQTKELVVYIHGVSPNGQQSHHETYATLHLGIRGVLPTFPEAFAGVEWGWHNGAAKPTSHQLLSDAEANLGGRSLRSVHDATDFTLNPFRVALDRFRPLMAYNFADMFYYVSEDGKSAIRYVVAKTIIDALKSVAEQDNISLTLIGHSAGSVVAFDFLFFLFSGKKAAREFIRAERVTATPSDKHGVADAGEVSDTLSVLEMLQDLAARGRVRVRRLFTFGSPITPLAYRSDAVLEVLAKTNGRLDVHDYGFDVDPPGFGTPLKGARWVNVWDKDDAIAWPVEPLMTRPGVVVKDVYVDVSDSPARAHESYWTDVNVHSMLGRAW